MKHAKRVNSITLWLQRMEDESAAALAPEAYPLPAQPAPVHQHMVQPVHKDQNQWENAPVELPKPVEVSRPGGNGSNAPEPRAGVEPSRAAYPSSAFAHAMDTAHTVDPRARGSESPTNSGDSESSEENAIKARAVAAAKARAAKEAEARDALLNPRPSSGGARNAGTAAKKAGAQLQAGGPTGALGSLASQMGGPYQAAMLRLQATISSLQSKVEKDNHLITAGDLETLYNNFDAMMNTHPVFSPAAKRARALAAASAVAEYRRAEMERQQGAAAALQQRGVGTSAGRRGRGTNSQPAHSDRSHLSNWSAGQGRYGATQPQVNWQAQQAQFSQQAEHPGPADAWGSTGGAQYQGAYPPYPSQQQSQHAYPAAPAQPYYDQGGPQDSGLTTFTGAGDAGRASQPGWAGQSATAATAAALSFPGAGGGGGLESELRSSTDLLRMLSSMIARGGEQQLGNRSYESQYAPPPPAPPQTAEEAE